MFKSRVEPLPYVLSTDNLNGSYKNIVAFIISLFTFLKINNMCFLSGSIIFEDNNNKLFNLLTYGLLNNINNNCNTSHPPLAKSHITFTHKEIYKKIGVSSSEDCFKLSINGQILRSFISKCADNKCLKMQLRLNKNINYLCDITTYDILKDTNNKSPKQVILFYRFKYNTINYLFFKLESHDMNSMSHSLNYLNKKRYDTYDKRREDNTSLLLYFNNYLYEKDNLFYDNLLSNLYNNDNDIINKIQFKINLFNKNLRTGKELFIFEELKELLLDEYLYNFINIINEFIEKPNPIRII
jgi:hypothetical protein